jgi:hypothetical protein
MPASLQQSSGRSTPFFFTVGLIGLAASRLAFPRSVLRLKFRSELGVDSRAIRGIPPMATADRVRTMATIVGLHPIGPAANPLLQPPSSSFTTGTGNRRKGVQIEAFFALIREISLAKVKSCPKLALVFRVK